MRTPVPRGPPLTPAACQPAAAAPPSAAACSSCCSPPCCAAACWPAAARAAGPGPLPHLPQRQAAVRCAGGVRQAGAQRQPPTLPLPPRPARLFGVLELELAAAALPLAALLGALPPAPPDEGAGHRRGQGDEHPGGSVRGPATSQRAGWVPPRAGRGWGGRWHDAP